MAALTCGLSLILRHQLVDEYLALNGLLEKC